jgi:hypothetical protein
MAQLLQEAHEVCSKVFVGSLSACQIGAVLPSGEKLCVGCAQTCHLPNTLKPLLSAAPFSCACAASGACLFAERRGDELTGAAKEHLLSALATEASTALAAAQSTTQQKMLHRITATCAQAHEFEDVQLHQRARAVMPLARLAAAARAEFAKAAAQRAAVQAAAAAEARAAADKGAEAEAADAPAAEISVRDRELKGLLHWFKVRFSRAGGRVCLLFFAA